MLFVGFVAGTFPSLYKTAGKEGRKSSDIWVLIISTVAIFTLMVVGGKQLTEVTPNIFIWLASGLLMGLGLIIPGMSPSNFLIYFGLYDKMAIGIKDFDFGVIIPLIIGFIICVISFAKVAAWMFRKYYSECIIYTWHGYRFFAGYIPNCCIPCFYSEGLDAAGLGFGASLLFSLVLFIVGAIASYLFSKVEERFPREELL